jgi:hypothetical protein
VCIPQCPQVSLLEDLPRLATNDAGLAFLQAHLLPPLLRWGGIAAGSDDGEGDDDGAAASHHVILGNAAVSTLADIVCVALAVPNSPTEVAGNAILASVFPGLQRCASEACSSGDDTDRVLVCTAAMSRLMAVSPVALDAVLSDTTLLQSWLECGVSSDAELRAGVLQGVAAVLQGRSSSGGGGAAGRDSAVAAAATSAAAASPSAGAAGAVGGSDDRCGRLFDALGRFCGRTTAEVALAALKRPEPSCRHAAYELLAAAAALPGEAWLRRVFGAAPTVAAYVLDRGTESDAEGAALKLQVVAAAATNLALQSLGEPFASVVRDFVGGEARGRALPVPQVALAS